MLQSRCGNNAYYKNGVYCHLLWIPDVSGDVMTYVEAERRWLRLVRSIFTDRRVQTERQSENSSRSKQGNLFEKTLQGVSAKSHTILSAVNVCASAAPLGSLLKSLAASLWGGWNRLWSWLVKCQKPQHRPMFNLILSLFKKKGNFDTKRKTGKWPLRN